MGAFLPKLGLAAIAALAISGTANAAVTITGFTAGQLGAPTGQHIVASFDSPENSGFSVNLGSVGQVVQFSQTNQYAAPLGDSTKYLAVLGDSSAVATLTTPSNVTDLSMYIGSVDYYNTIKFYNTSNALVQTFTGTQLAAYGTDGRFFFDLTGSNIGSVTFGSKLNALEIDNIAASVPEPGVWAMMMLGLGGLGYALRRRRFAGATA